MQAPRHTSSFPHTTTTEAPITPGPIADAAAAGHTTTALASLAPVADQLLAQWASGSLQRELSRALDQEEVPLTHIGKVHRRSRSPPPTQAPPKGLNRDTQQSLKVGRQESYGAPIRRPPLQGWITILRSVLRAQHAGCMRFLRTCDIGTLRAYEDPPEHLTTDAAPTPPQTEEAFTKTQVGGPLSPNHKPLRRNRPSSEGAQPTASIRGQDQVRQRGRSAGKEVQEFIIHTPPDPHRSPTPQEMVNIKSAKRSMIQAPRPRRSIKSLTATGPPRPCS